MFSPKSPNVSLALVMDNVRAFLLLGGRPRAVYAQAFHRFSHIIHNLVHKLSTRVPAAFEVIPKAPAIRPFTVSRALRLFNHGF